MIKNKINFHKKKYCLLLACLFIVSGCVSGGKRTEIIGIQKKRISGLEKELKQKNKIIDKMKVQRWVNKPIRVAEKIAFRPLVKQIKNKQWVQALATSYRLTKRYPNSMKLRSYRYAIFKKMGLRKQASSELRTLKSLRAKARRKQSLKR